MICFSNLAYLIESKINLKRTLYHVSNEYQEFYNIYSTNSRLEIITLNKNDLLNNSVSYVK